MNTHSIGHVKISIMQHSVDAMTLFLHTSIYFWGLLVEVMRTKFPMGQAGKELLVKSHLNYCMNFGNLFFINTRPIRTLANPSNVVILKKTQNSKGHDWCYGYFPSSAAKNPESFGKWNTFGQFVDSWQNLVQKDCEKQRVLSRSS